MLQRSPQYPAEAPSLSRRAESIRPSGTSLAQIAAMTVGLNRRDIADFTIGEIGLPLDGTMARAAMEAVRAGHARYTDTLGLPELRQMIADMFAAQTGSHWSYEEVALGGGAKSGLYFLSLILLDPGDEVIIPRPHWQTFPRQVEMAGGRPVLVAHRSDGQLDMEAIAAAISPRTRAVIINTPNNPTGAVYSRDTLKAVADLAVERNIWIIFDQCYQLYTYGDSRHHNIVAIAPEIRDRTIIVDSFSKALGVAGWRLGYVGAPPEIIAKIRAYQSHITSCPNVFAQHAVLRALTDGVDELQARCRTHLEHNRELGLDILAQAQGVRLAPAQGGFYFYLDVRSLLGRACCGRRIGTVDDLAELLVSEAQAATVPGTAFSDPEAIRICYAGGTSCLNDGLKRIVGLINSRMS